MEHSMQRFFATATCLVFSLLLVGCASDTRAGLIKDTIGLMQDATAKVNDIKKAVTVAISKADGGKINLTEAMDSTKGLEDEGPKAQDLKRRIDRVRLQVSEEDRKKYANEMKGEISEAFASLLKARSELKAELAKAEEANPNNKSAVKDLRARIEKAESPFEAIARH
jgi:hypothetical protein